MNEALNAHVAHQLGLVTRVQAREHGFSDHQIDWLIQDRQWIAIHPGVHRMATAPQSYEQRVLAAVLAAGPGAYASRRTAARLIGTREFVADVVEVDVPLGRRPRLKGVLVRPARVAVYKHG